MYKNGHLSPTVAVFFVTFLVKITYNKYINQLNKKIMKIEIDKKYHSNGLLSYICIMVFLTKEEAEKQNLERYSMPSTGICMYRPYSEKFFKNGKTSWVQHLDEKGNPIKDKCFTYEYAE
jgi:hypothetical protein